MNEPAFASRVARHAARCRYVETCRAGAMTVHGLAGGGDRPPPVSEAAMVACTTMLTAAERAMTADRFCIIAATGTVIGTCMMLTLAAQMSGEDVTALDLDAIDRVSSDVWRRHRDVLETMPTAQRKLLSPPVTPLSS